MDPATYETIRGLTVSRGKPRPRYVGRDIDDIRKAMKENDFTSPTDRTTTE